MFARSSLLVPINEKRWFRLMFFVIVQMSIAQFMEKKKEEKEVLIVNYAKTVHCTTLLSPFFLLLCVSNFTLSSSLPPFFFSQCANLLKWIEAHKIPSDRFEPRQPKTNADLLALTKLDASGCNITGKQSPRSRMSSPLYKLGLRNF